MDKVGSNTNYTNYTGDDQLRNRGEISKRNRGEISKRNRGEISKRKGTGSDDGAAPVKQIIRRSAAITKNEKNYVETEKRERKKKDQEKDACLQCLETLFGEQSNSSIVDTSKRKSSHDCKSSEEEDDEWMLMWMNDYAYTPASSVNADCQAQCEDACAGAPDNGECVAQCMDECDIDSGD